MMQRNWILAAALAVAFGSAPALADHHMKSENGVPGIDVDVSSRDRGNDENNGVPGVDMNVSVDENKAERGLEKAERNTERSLETAERKTENAMQAAEREGKQAMQKVERGVERAADRTEGAVKRVMRDDDPIEPETVKDAMEQVREAEEVLNKMLLDKDAAKALASAKGVLISPDYGRAGLIVGAHAGNGVLLIKSNGRWTGPALYNLGGLSIGAQAGASIGQSAMLLMTDKAVSQFRKNNDFALTADAGLTVIGWSAKAQGRTGGDIVVWSDQGGAYAGVSIGIQDVNFDERETAALYGKRVEARDIIAGKVKAPANVGISRVIPMG